MDFLGIGPVELMVILAVALIVVGPRKLPDLGRQVGRAIYQFRKATQEITDEFAREFGDVTSAVDGVRSTEFNPLNTIRNSVNEVVSSINEPLKAPLGSSTTPPPGPAALTPPSVVPTLDPVALKPPPVTASRPLAQAAPEVAFATDFAVHDGPTARQGRVKNDTRSAVADVDPAGGTGNVSDGFGDDGLPAPLAGNVVAFDPNRNRGDVA